MQGYAQAAAIPIGEANSPAMRLGNFTREGKTKAGAAPFGGIKGQQRLRENGLAHSRSAITRLDALFGSTAISDRSTEDRMKSAGQSQ